MWCQWHCTQICGLNRRNRWYQPLSLAIAKVATRTIQNHISPKCRPIEQFHGLFHLPSQLATASICIVWSQCLANWWAPSTKSNWSLLCSSNVGWIGTTLIQPNWLPIHSCRFLLDRRHAFPMLADVRDCTWNIYEDFLFRIVCFVAHIGCRLWGYGRLNSNSWIANEFE